MISHILCRFFLFIFVLLGAAQLQAEAGLRTLYLTDFNNPYHDYEQSLNSLQALLEQKLNLALTVVGRQSKESLDLLKKPGFLNGYQLFIYNACFADNTDLQLLRNLNQEIQNSGVPTVFLHCAMHNFRWSSEEPGIYGIGKSSRLKKVWAKTYPREAFPAFWQLTGMDTVNHDWIGAFTVDKVMDHPITQNLPASWKVSRDERYRTLRLQVGVIPLLKSGDSTIAWLHSFGKARIFATTLGHDDETLKDPLFGELLSQGIVFITGKRSNWR